MDTAPQLVIFDLDDTLWTSQHGLYFSLYSDTINILHELRERGIPAVVASHNTGGWPLLRHRAIADYFTHAECYYDDTRKMSHLMRIMARYPHIPPHRMVFFDDLGENLVSAISLGIRAFSVNPDRGVRLDTVRGLFG